MSDEPRKPIFGFLWPKPDPLAPVDEAYRQVRQVRVAPRGPIRVAGLLIGSLAMIITTGSLIMAAVATTLSPATLVGAALSASALVLILRGWVVGTYVTDAGLTVETTWRRVSVPWAGIRVVEERAMPAPLLGLPVRVPSRRSVIETTDGRTLLTHVYTASPDLWLRPEAFDMARLRLERWSQDR